MRKLGHTERLQKLAKFYWGEMLAMFPGSVGRGEMPEKELAQTGRHSFEDEVSGGDIGHVSSM